MFLEFAFKSIIFPDLGEIRQIDKNNPLFNTVEGIPYFTMRKDDVVDEPDILIRIFYSHGNGDHLFKIKNYMKRFIDEHIPSTIGGKSVHVTVMAWDYPSYGESKKSRKELTEYRIYRDAEICYHEFEKIRAFKEHTKTITILMGNSLGCAPTLNLATYIKPDIVYLTSPFKSILNVANLPLTTYFIKDMFTNYKMLNDVPKKTYLVCFQSEVDEVIDYKTNSDVYIDQCDYYFTSKTLRHRDFFGKKGMAETAKVLVDAIEKWMYQKKNPDSKRVDEKVY